MNYDYSTVFKAAKAEFDKTASEVEPMLKSMEAAFPGSRLKLAESIITKHADLQSVLSGLGQSASNGFGQAGDWISKNLNISPDAARTGLGAGGGLIGALLLSQLFDMDLPQALLLSLAMGGGGGYLGHMFGEGKGLGKGQYGSTDPEKAYGPAPAPQPMSVLDENGNLNPGSPTWNNPEVQGQPGLGYDSHPPTGSSFEPAAIARASQNAQPPSLLPSSVKVTNGANPSTRASGTVRPAATQPPPTNQAQPLPRPSGLLPNQPGSGVNAPPAIKPPQQPKPLAAGKPNSLGIVQPNLKPQ